MTPYPLRSNGKWLRVRYGAIMTPYQMICGSPFKMVVNLDFWHLWVFFLLVLKKFRGWQNPSKKVKVRLLSDFFWKIKLYQLCHFPFCSNWSLSLFNFHESFSITGDTIRIRFGIFCWWTPLSSTTRSTRRTSLRTRTQVLELGPRDWIILFSLLVCPGLSRSVLVCPCRWFRFFLRKNGRRYSKRSLWT